MFNQARSCKAKPRERKIIKAAGAGVDIPEHRANLFDSSNE
jgi:hypothetical protein